jgi:hypothetical protein
MLSFLEMGFYLSLAVMLCLLFLLINHLKSRIITLENQNEGMMDVMKMIRGNLVNSDKEQKHIKDSVVSLARNVSQVSATVMNNNNRNEKHNITLDIEDVYKQRQGGNVSYSSAFPKSEWADESEEEEDTEEGTQEMTEEKEEDELEVVNIDWPSKEEIEIHKLATDDLSEYEEPEFQQRMKEMAQAHISTPMFMNSSEASELQKLFFMMSMGNGVPMSEAMFENKRDYTILPEAFDDPAVEQLPETPMPELISVESDDSEIPDSEKEPIQETMETVETVSIPTEESSTTPVEESVSVIEQSLGEEEAKQEVADEKAEEKAEEKEEEKRTDFSKMDVRTLRSLISAQGKWANEAVSKMKKVELIRLLSSSI